MKRTIDDRGASFKSASQNIGNATALELRPDPEKHEPRVMFSMGTVVETKEKSRSLAKSLFDGLWNGLFPSKSTSNTAATHSQLITTHEVPAHEMMVGAHHIVSRDEH